MEQTKALRAGFSIVIVGVLLVTLSASADAEEATPTEAEAGLAASPEPTVEELIQSLRAPDPTTRVDAVRTLGERRERAAVPHLITLLRADPLPEVRGWIVRALHEIGTPEGSSAVVTAAREDPDERVRRMSAQLEGVSVPPPPPFSPAGPRIESRTAVPPLYEPSRPAPPPQPPGRGLRRAGIITTSASYGLALIVGLALITSGDEDEWGDSRNYVDWGWKMMLPIVGPAVAATTNDIGGASVVFWIWSAAQIAGVTLLSIGFAQRARWLREQAGDDEDEPEAAGRRWGLAVLPGPGGLSLSGYF